MTDEADLRNSLLIQSVERSVSLDPHKGKDRHGPRLYGVYSSVGGVGGKVGRDDKHLHKQMVKIMIVSIQC